MARRKIAILGGGIGSLATAFELTRTPELAAKHEVTVYQMGWRLGGKCASGRNGDPRFGSRIEEHGLHVWLGFYENAFAMLKDTLRERAPRPDDRFRTWRDVFVPRSFTPIGEQDDAGWKFWPVDWPTNADEPGDGRLILTPWGAFTGLLSLLEGWGGQWPGAHQGGILARVAGWFRDVFADLGHLEALGLAALLGVASELAGKLEGDASNHDPAKHAEVAAILRLAHHRLHATAASTPVAASAPTAVPLVNLLDLGLAIARGILSPRYGILAHGDLERIDDQDFRAWLVDNGASPDLVQDGPELRAFYDLAFAYDGGHRDRPRWAAGTALRALLRIVLTYKGAVLYLPNAGMGEAFIAPVYQVLRARGVDFRFFRRVSRLELSPDRNVVARVKLDVQARTPGDRAYEPLLRVEGVDAWPSEPFWDQLVDGPALKGRHVDFESNWCAEPPVGQEVLEVGRDFDDVVLGISLGAFKRLNDEPTMCDELYEANPRFAAMADALGLVPTQSLQFWTQSRLKDLGWPKAPPAMDAGPEPLGIWADMSHQLPTESWPDPKPGSLQYLCGVWATDLHTRPRSDATVPARARADVRRLTADWLASSAGSLWPRATIPGSKTALDYGVLRVPPGTTGDARLDAQWIRANVDPTECCVTSLEGTTSLRLAAHESGFVNLTLAGDWISHGMNVACVEGAVMSGMSAARALCGAPRDIVGEWFFRTPKPSAAQLPPYVSGLRHGEQSFQPPGLTKGGRIHVFPVAGDPARMQAFVDATFTVPSRGQVRYAVLGSHALVMLYDAPELTSLSQIVGTIPDRECGFCIPLLRLSPRGPKLVFWIPYLFIDSSIGMVTGREIWGFPKEIGTFVFPGPTDPARFVVSATIFPRLSPTTQGTLSPLVQVERPGVYGTAVRAWDAPGAWLRELVHGLTGGTGRVGSRSVADVLEHDVLDLFDPFAMTIANLKQFRDAVEPTRACHQSITETPLRFDLSTFRGAGSLGDGWQLTLTPAQSHEIARDLGLPASPIPIVSPSYIDIGFTAAGGSVIWKAPGT